MCGCSSQNFMDIAISNPNVTNVGNPTQLTSSEMFGTDSMNPLGATEVEESEMHEELEPKGPNGEDID